MSSVCTDQQHHKFHSSHQLFSPTTKKTLLRHIDIPPRKLLLSRRSMNLENSDGFSPESAKISSADETLLQKFFLENPGAISGGGGGGEAFTETDDDPYSSDHFRMYEFKIRRCTRSRSHDWTDCPFAHPGEKARRRDPRRYQYSGTVCPDYRRGGCSRGENCQFAHGVFESWLHPARYRTEACKDGKHCKRKVCFFAHTPRQLRILPPNFSAGCGGGGERCCPVLPDRTVESNLSPNSNSSNPSNHCCAYCHVFTNSPTSTLMGVSQCSPPMSPSPPLSPVKCHPPLSPVKCHPISKYSPFSRYSDRLMMNCGPSDLNNKFNAGGGMLSYKDAFTELMSSLEAMNVQEKASHAGTNKGNFTCFNGGEDQNQIILSPSGPNLSGSGRDFVNGGCNSRKSENIPFSIDDNNGGSCPDLGWVNELLK